MAVAAPVRAPVPALTIIRPGAWIPDPLREQIRTFQPRSHLGKLVRDSLRYLPTEQAIALLDAVMSSLVVESSLALVHGRWDDRLGRVVRDDYGIVSRKVITTAGVTYLAADMAGGASDINLFKYHGIGTGTNAEASGDTALQTESTTALNPDSTRATGSQASSTNTYTTVGTLTADASIACTEHGIFSQAATGGGTLWDRTVFTVINLASGDSIQATYVATFSAGG